MNDNDETLFREISVLVPRILRRYGRRFPNHDAATTTSDLFTKLFERVRREPIAAWPQGRLHQAIWLEARNLFIRRLPGQQWYQTEEPS